ncbi:hypothetical protein F5B22DRAFT_641357 [Xylaria bambusicola]|uniref:uncharacterized protein n=1 Tax=Xylaria bambusicola TaxID=326684 RepID=UPI002008C52C|nr:uncharacterized protein F5B22DRAFT_641357 [Xylaria bambusicola]KAI0526209.1 hypothetical protein F5B22DRAFT_641357 [Xylaria bambusicola]
MAYNYYNPNQSSYGADSGNSGGGSEEPVFSMQPQAHPTCAIPSDEVLVKSFYKQLLKDRWELRYKPNHDSPDEYILPRSLTGNKLWIQRKTAFFRAHRDISEDEVYIANRRSFLRWIEQRFRPATAGICGATEDLCFIVGNYVFWVDPAAVAPQPSFNTGVQPSLDSSYYGGGYYPGSSRYYRGSSAGRA